MRTVISRGRYKFPSGGKDTVWARREESGPDSAGALGPFASVQHVIKGEKVVTGLFLLKVAQSYPVLWSQEENLFLAARQLTTLNPSSQFPRRPLSFLPAFFPSSLAPSCCVSYSRFHKPHTFTSGNSLFRLLKMEDFFTVSCVVCFYWKLIWHQTGKTPAIKRT